MSTHIINFPGADIHTTTITSVSNVSVGENLDVASNLTVSGNTVVSQELSVSGNVEVGTANLFVDTTTGNVGVGVAHPTSAKLQVAGSLGMAKGSEFFAGDDVVMELPKHDRPLVKYPEVVMTASAENVSGYEGYTVQYSGRYDSSFSAWTLFGEEFTGSNDEATSGAWVESPNTTYAKEAADAYNGVVGSVLTTVQNAETLRLASNTPIGAWISLELPNSIKLAHIDMRPRLQHASETNLNNVALQAYPRDFGIWGYNGGVWVLLKTVTNHKHTGTAFTYDRISVDSGVVYNKYAIVITRTNAVGGSNANDRNFAAIGQLYFYGYEEGDTSVDVVHRSIPNKPGQQHLEVYWDANDSNSYSFADSSNVYDLSGSGVKGTITGTNGFDPEYNAWVFDGSGDYILSENIGFSGDQTLAVSLWFRYNSIPTGRQDIFGIGKSGTAVQFGLATYTPGTYLYTGGNDIYNTGYNLVQDTEWHHIVAIYSGGTPSTTTMSLYLDGVNIVSKLSTSSASQAVSFDSTNCKAYIGDNVSTGASLNGKITNFRLYSKALNADQVRELYEYDAERFGHRQNLVALHKGNLGVGVAHPTARFEVAGADGLQEYPPQAMTGYETYMEGHGVFRVSASSFVNNSYTPYNAFDKNLYNAWLNKNNSNDSRYLGTDNLYSGINGLGGYSGEWIGLKLPHGINLKTVAIHPRQVSGSYNEMPEDGVILGYDDKTGEYETLDSWVGVVLGEYEPHVRTIQTAKTYNQFFLLGTRTVSHSDNLRIGELKFFGTPTPSSLEDGHLTLGKALTTPRVSGHAAGAETPRAESLVVHYDTTVDSVKSGNTVVDTSGNGINSAMQNGLVYSSSERALVFDGTNDRTYISSVKNGSGAWVHSMSLWCKSNSAANDDTDTFFFIGEKSTYRCIGLETQTNGNIRYYFWGSDGDTPTDSFTRGVWHHVAVTYDGGSSTTSKSVYIDGVKQTLTQSAGTTALNLYANDEFFLGSQHGGTKPLDGSISNFKLWNVALTADEVAAEYALGRTGKALNVTDTSVCLGGTVPRAQLDVRGSARFDGNVGIGTASPVATLDVNGSVRISGTMSLPGLPYAFVTYGTNTGWTAFNNSILPHSSVKVQSSHNAFDTSTYKFTCPNDGVYKISVSNLVGQNGYVHIYFQKNGARIDPNIHLNQNGKGPWWINMTGDHIVACSAGDELYINGHTGGTYTDIYVNSAYAYAYYQQIA